MCSLEINKLLKFISLDSRSFKVIIKEIEVRFLAFSISIGVSSGLNIIVS